MGLDDVADKSRPGTTYEKVAGQRPSDERVERTHFSSMISAVDLIDVGVEIFLKVSKLLYLHAVFLFAEPPHVPSDPPSRPSI